MKTTWRPGGEPSGGTVRSPGILPGSRSRWSTQRRTCRLGRDLAQEGSGGYRFHAAHEAASRPQIVSPHGEQRDLERESRMG